MITLKQFSWEIARIISGGQLNKDTELDTRYITSLIRTAMNELIPIEVIRKRSAADDRSAIRMYIASYTLDVEFDDDTLRSYADLPEFYQSMAYNRGIYAVSAVDKPHEPMIQRLNPEVTSRLPCGKLQGQIGFSVEGFRIWWDKNLGAKGTDIAKVLARIIVAAPDTIGLDDMLPIIPQQKAIILDRVLAWYGQEGIQDKISDENKDLGVRIQDNG